MDRWKRISLVILLGAASILSADKESYQDNTTVKKDSNLLQEAKINYITAAEIFTDLVKKGELRESELGEFFSRVKETLDEHRYKGNFQQKQQIVDLAYLIEPTFAKDIDFLIDKVILLLQDLKIV